MLPELELITPLVFTFAMILTLWLSLTAVDVSPNSGVLIIHEDDASFYSIS